MCRTSSEEAHSLYIRERLLAAQRYDKKRLAVNRLKHYTNSDPKKISTILIALSKKDTLEASRKWCLVHGDTFSSVLSSCGITVAVSGRNVSIRDPRGTQTFEDDYFYSGLYYCLGSFIESTKLEPELVYTRLPNSIKSLGFTGSQREASAWLAGRRDEADFGVGLAYRLVGAAKLSLRKVDATPTFLPVRVDGQKPKLDVLSLVSAGADNFVKIFDYPLDEGSLRKAASLVTLSDYRKHQKFHDFGGFSRLDFKKYYEKSPTTAIGVLSRLAKADFFRDKMKELSCFPGSSERTSEIE